MQTDSLRTDSSTAPQHFFVVAREPGAEHPALPTWANRSLNPGKLDETPAQHVVHKDVPNAPGVFQLLNVLSPDDCQRIVELSEKMGYLPDAAVSLPRSVRHNDNVTWVADTSTVELLWNRCLDAFMGLQNFGLDKRPLGLNARFRFYRYKEGDYFKPHMDGAWFGSAVENDQLITDAFGDRYSQFSFVLFLSEGFGGGRTEFYVNKNTNNIVRVATPIGGAVCFPHGNHPMHCLHSSETITHGVKYIIRTDVLYEI